jgi:FecR protein
MAAHEVRRFVLPGALAALVSLFPAVHAQTGPPIGQATYAAAEERDWTGQVPAHLWIVDGDAVVEREGRVETATENMALLEGDRLRTERGRVEVLFEDGSALDLDEFSRIDLMSDSLVRLLDGRIRLTIARGASTLDYRVDTPAGAVQIRGAGDYRIALSLRRAADPELQVAVLRGTAEIVNANGRTLLRAGDEGIATERRVPSPPYTINSASWDSFDRWVETARDSRVGRQSSRYLPADLRYYGGVFDTYGTWDYVSDYGGYAWYPTVPVGWRPYSVGSWSLHANFGWLWVGAGRWAWPTHHYGRWGLAAGRWYWVPGHKWAPAWVAWGGAPGYVGWCPLGYRGGPVVGFGAGYYANPWAAWTVVPSRVFVNTVPVHRIVVPNHAVGYASIAPRVRGQFGARQAAPTIAVATPSRIEPLRAPTFARGAVPRTGADPRTRGIDGGAAVRSRIPAAEPRSIEPPRIQTPSRLEVPRVEVPRLETPNLAAPPAPRAQPRSRVPMLDQAPSTESPGRVFRSREPDAVSGYEPVQRNYRSRLPDSPSVPPPPRGAFVESRGASERASSPSDRSRPEPSGVRSRIPSGEIARPDPGERPRGEMRSPGPSSSTQPASPSSGGRGQAVRRGGGV